MNTAWDDVFLQADPAASNLAYLERHVPTWGQHAI